MIVETAAGRIRGAQGSFLGIPYARAERFGAPKPISWLGVRDAFEPGPAAPQPPSRLEHVVGPMPLPQSEDCLSLNIFTPSTTGSRPVLVWIHGGGFTSGSGGQVWYTGTRLAAEADVVVVTLNYRLGALGFLTFGDLPPNRGLADQGAALEWVHANIAAFGGDPARVTLAGQSAGAQSTLALWWSPRTRGLVRQFALQSAPLGLTPSTRATAEEHADRLTHEVGTKDLHDVPVARLLAAQEAIATPGQLEPPFQLVADDDLVAPDLIAAAPPGRALISWTREEARAFFPDAPAEFLEAVSAKFFAGDVPRLAAKLDSLAYRFDWAAPGNPLGACHCLDIPFLFGTHAVWDAPMLRGAPRDIADVDDLRKIWGTFLHGEDQAAVSARTAASTSAKLGFTSAVEPTITVGTVSFPFAT